MKLKKQKRELNDLLLPILFVISILPLITRLIVYESGLSVYPWFSSNDITTDFFSYYKSTLFLITAIICIIILLFLFLLYRDTWKNCKPFAPLVIYTLTAILSTIYSVDSHTSIVGGVGRFENIFVLLGYLVLSLYTYQTVKKKEDFKIIIKALLLSTFLLIIIGLFQMIGLDFIQFEWIQKLIIPQDYWIEYLGTIRSHISSNAVSLTLFNPNYASVYMAMIIPFFIALMITTNNKKERILYFIIVTLSLIILFMTYSRTGLVSLFISLLILGYCCRNYLKNIRKQIFIAFVLFMAIFTSLDAISNFTFLSRIISTFQSFNMEQFNYSLEEIVTKKNAIYIRYQGEELYISFKDNSIDYGDLQFHNHLNQDISYLYDSHNYSLAMAPFDNLEFHIEHISDVPYIIAKIHNKVWHFTYIEDIGYQYYNDLGKYDSLEPIISFGFENHQNIASGRGYIWSRSLPLLRDNLFIGSGPDTFMLIYPQQDYVGKSNNCKTPYTLIEKAHNMYLGIGLQTGVISLISFLCFIFIYIKKSFSIYGKCKLKNYTSGIGIGCLAACISYMISGIFNDSSILTSPLFWILIGLGMAANYSIEKELYTNN